MPKKPSRAKSRAFNFSKLSKFTVKGAVKTPAIIKVMAVVMVLAVATTVVYARTFAGSAIRLSNPSVYMDGLEGNNVNYTWYVSGNLKFSQTGPDDFYVKINTNCERYGAPAKGTDPDSAFEWHFYEPKDFRTRVLSAKVLAKYGRPAGRLVDSTWFIKDIKGTVVAEGKTKVPNCNPTADKIIFPINYKTWSSDNIKDPGAVQKYKWTLRVLDTGLTGNIKISLDSNCTNTYKSDNTKMEDSGNVTEWIKDWEEGGHNMVAMVPLKELVRRETDIGYKVTLNDVLLASGKVKGPVCGSTVSDINASTLTPSTGTIARLPFKLSIRNDKFNPGIYAHWVLIKYMLSGKETKANTYVKPSVMPNLTIDRDLLNGTPDKNTPLNITLYTCKSVDNFSDLTKCASNTYTYNYGGQSEAVNKVILSEPQIKKESGYTSYVYTGTISNEYITEFDNKGDLDVYMASNCFQEAPYNFPTDAYTSKHFITNGKITVSQPFKDLYYNDSIKTPYTIRYRGQLVGTGTVSVATCKTEKAYTVGQPVISVVEGDGPAYATYIYKMGINKLAAKEPGSVTLQIKTDCEGKAVNNKGSFTWTKPGFTTSEANSGVAEFSNKIFKSVLGANQDFKATIKYSILSKDGVILDEGTTLGPVCS